MIEIDHQAIPQVVQAHLAAYRANADRLMATLAPDALVNDEHREMLGDDAIRKWAERQIFGDNLTIEVVKAFENRGAVILRAKVDGDFDKSNLPDPLILTYYFNLAGDKISQLIILLNKENAL